MTRPGYKACIWPAGGDAAPVSLGVLPGGTTSAANGANANGSLIVGPGAAFFWDAISGITALPDLAGGTTECRANAVSASGARAVGFGSAATGQQAVMWTLPAGITVLGDLPGGLTTSSAFDVSDDGQVVVGYGGDASGTSAMVWTPTSACAAPSCRLTTASRSRACAWSAWTPLPPTAARSPVPP